jgi:hypothetical protein
MSLTSYIQTFMGMTFNVYSMGWYVEAQAAQRDPLLQSFQHMPVADLQQTQAFYDRMCAPGAPFDRTLLVKLAMTLKTKMLLEGFLNEVVLQPQNKAAVVRASARYTVPVCPEGLEILFTWRVPHHGGADRAGASKVKQTQAPAQAQTQAQTSQGEEEYLEVRMGDMYFELHERGLAEDFMRQFFAPLNPVSPAAKKGFATYFPAMMKSGSHSS